MEILRKPLNHSKYSVWKAPEIQLTFNEIPQKHAKQLLTELAGLFYEYCCQLQKDIIPELNVASCSFVEKGA